MCVVLVEDQGWGVRGIGGVTKSENISAVWAARRNGAAAWGRQVGYRGGLYIL